MHANRMQLPAHLLLLAVGCKQLQRYYNNGTPDTMQARTTLRFYPSTDNCRRLTILSVQYRIWGAATHAQLSTIAICTLRQSPSQ